MFQMLLNCLAQYPTPPTFNRPPQYCLSCSLIKWSMVSHHHFVLPFQKSTLENFKCGGDFLPSPLASKPRFALAGAAVLTQPSLLTAVAVAVENDHTIAFLGNNQGEVFKVDTSFYLSDPYSFSLLLVGSRMGDSLVVFCPGTPHWWAVCIRQDSWGYHEREGQQEPFLWP